MSNRDGRPRLLEPGLYGLSNHLLETLWLKVRNGKSALGRVLDAGPRIASLLGLLADTSPAPDAELVHTGAGLERERMLSAARIVSPDYGMRCSSVAIIENSGRLQFAERGYDPAGEAIETRRYELHLSMEIE